MDARNRRAPLAAALMLLVACTGAHADPSSSVTPSTAAPAGLAPKVAYLQDETIDEPLQHELPALQGLRLALEGAVEDGTLAAPVDVVDLDTQGDPATALELAREIVADPSYVAVVIAPQLDESEAVGQVLDDGGLATIGLSTLGAAGDAWNGRLRLVPREAAQVRALAAYLRTRAAPPVCLVSEGSAAADPLGASLAGTLGDRVVEEEVVADDPVPADALARLRDARCETVAWTGSSSGAATLRTAMSQAGLGDVALVGSDLVKTDTYLTTSGRAGEGTVVSCPCADLSTSTALRDQVFVHDYQSEFGTPPAPFAAEGWDAGGILVRALPAGEGDRAAVRTSIDAIDRYRGLASTYAFGPDGELAPGSGRVGFWVDRGQRWATPRWEDPAAGWPAPGRAGHGAPGPRSAAGAPLG